MPFPNCVICFVGGCLKRGKKAAHKLRQEAGAGAGRPELGEGHSTLPVPFWQVSVAALSSREWGESKGEPG